MIVINRDYFNLNFDYLIPTFNHNISFIEKLKSYIKLFKNLYNLRAILISYFNNLDTFLFINKLNTVDKIDEVLISLEEISEFTNELLYNTRVKKWYNLPLYYMIDKLEDRNMALQGLLLSKQAHL